MKAACTIAKKAREPNRILILMVKDAKIKVTKDGPYLITGGIPLLRMVIESDSHGDPCLWRLVQRYPQRESYALCRCRESKNKPYCDGAHAMQRFDGTETAGGELYLENVKEYLGPELKLTDKPELCSGAGFCIRDAGIWNLTVYSDRPGFKEIAIEEAANCPSGRLVVWDNQGNPIEPDYESSIVVTEDENGSPGPLWVRGGVEIESATGKKYEKRNRITLCRCGKSLIKPLCDGSHSDK
jgi:CDGSH-type Zn-finger protein